MCSLPVPGSLWRLKACIVEPLDQRMSCRRARAQYYHISMLSIRTACAQ